MEYIPKIIHYCWFGENPMPEKVVQCIRSWKDMCPDYEIKRWDESNYDYRKNKYMAEAYRKQKWGFVPDYARLDIIYTYGGFYLDTDVQLLHKLDDLRSNKCFMGFEKNYVSPGLIIGAQCGIPEIKECMEEYDKLNFVNLDGTLNLRPSPRYMSDYLGRKGFKLNNKKQTIGNITIYPSDYFCPKDMITGECVITENTYSIHHYDASWWGEKEKKDFVRQVKLRKKNIWLWRIYNGINVLRNDGIGVLNSKVIKMVKKNGKD